MSTAHLAVLATSSPARPADAQLHIYCESHLVKVWVDPHATNCGHLKAYLKEKLSADESFMGHPIEFSDGEGRPAAFGGATTLAPPHAGPPTVGQL